MSLKPRFVLLTKAFRLAVHLLCLIALTHVLVFYNRLTKARFQALGLMSEKSPPRSQSEAFKRETG